MLLVHGVMQGGGVAWPNWGNLEGEYCTVSLAVAYYKIDGDRAGLTVLYMKVELVNSFTFVRDIATRLPSHSRSKLQKKSHRKGVGQVVSLENLPIRNTEVCHWKRAYSYSEQYAPLDVRRDLGCLRRSLARCGD